MSAITSKGVVAGLDIHPPRQLAIGRGNAFVIAGYCYHPSLRTRDLHVEIGGRRQRVDRLRLPRQDVFARAEENGGGQDGAFRSGFVAMPSIAPFDREEDAEVRLVLSLEDGSEARPAVGEVRLQPEPTVPSARGPRFPESAGPRVAICMATFNPPADLLRRQLDSIRGQTHGNWVCVISDDASEPAALANLEEEIAGDPRFVLSPSEARLGFYGNFERALSMAPPSAEFVTLCDQDDFWHPNKLDGLLQGIGADTQLVYSDARVVKPGGAVIHSSYWTARRNNHTNFGSLLLANSVTGAASLFRRDLLDDVLPFPPKLADPFHDHWLAVVALARGRIEYVNEPLYDYVQHSGAVIGHSTANRRPRPIRQHLRERLRRPSGGSRVVYYYNWYQELLFAQVLRLRCWERMDPARRRVVRRLLKADTGLTGIPWLLGRRVRRLWGHNETLDRELFYAHALVRRRAVSLWTLGRSRPGRVLPRDESVPPAYVNRSEVEAGP